MAASAIETPRIPPHQASACHGSILPGLQFVNRRVLAGHADAPADPVPVGDQGPRGLRLNDERYITGLNFGRRGAPRE
jgi:hypothetical protein